MRSILGKFNDSRGQVLIIFVLMFTVITIVGILVVDLGLWYSERRADQTDADLPALAGARQCMLQMVSGDYGNTYDPAPVVDRVWKDNVAGHGSDTDFSYTTTPCLDPTTGGACTDGSPLCCVDVVAKHKTEEFFSALPLAGGVFKNIAENMDAKARACAGEAMSQGETMPAYVVSGGDCFKNGNPEEPDYDNYCWVVGGAHDPLRPERQTLNLDKTGEVCSPGDHKDDVEEMFRNQGTGGNCSINTNDPPACLGSPWMDCVDVYTGNPFHSQDAVYDRITPPPCDIDGNGIDDLDEAIDAATHEPIVCSPDAPVGQQISPRLITVPLIDNPGEGTCGDGPPCPILGLASFYIAGCVDDRDDLEAVLTGARDLTGPDDDPKNEIQCTKKIPDGHDAVLGRWVSTTTAGGGVGPADDSTTLYGIALCDWETPVDQGGCGGSGGTPGPTSVPTATPGPTNTPRPPTATPVPPTATPCPCGTKPNGTCNKC